MVGESSCLAVDTSTVRYGTSLLLPARIMVGRRVWGLGDVW